MTWQEIRLRARMAGIWAVLCMMGMAGQLLAIGWPPRGWSIIVSTGLIVFVSKASHPETAVSPLAPPPQGGSK